MLHLQSLRLTTALMWQSLYFQFEPGVTVVAGPNRSGKSTIWRLMGQAVWGSAAGKRGTDASRIPEDASVRLIFKGHDKGLWKVTASKKAVAIVHDGKNLRLPGTQAGRTQLQAAFGMDQDVFESSVLVEGAVPNPLTLATPSQRALWFSRVAGHDAFFDTMAEAVAERLSRARNGAITVSALVSASAIDEEQLSAVLAKTAGSVDSLPALARKADGLAKEVEALTSRYNLRRLVVGMEDAKPADPRPSMTTAEAEEVIRKAEAIIKTHQAIKAKTNTLRDLKAAAAAKLPERSIPGVQSACLKAVVDALSSAKAENEKSVFAWKEQRLLRQRRKAAGFRTGGQLTEAFEEARLRARTLDASLLEAKAKMEKAKSAASAVTGVSTCPTCGQSVKNAKHLKAELRAAEHHCSMLKKKAARWWNRVEELEAMSPEVELVPIPKRVNIRDTTIEHLRKAASSAAAWEVADKERRQARRLLAKARESIPDTPSMSMEAASSKKDVAERAIAANATWDRYEETKARAEKVAQDLGLSFKDLMKIDFDALEIQKLSKMAELERVSKARREAEQAQTEINMLRSRIKAARRRIRLAQIPANRLPIYEELSQAFGRNGLRLSCIEDFIVQFEAALNEGTPLLWPSSCSFRVTMNKKDGVAIYLTRSNGRTGDLTTLSGSEGRVWKLLCAYALLRTLPSERRCDTIILDEMESMMDARSRDMFVSEFIPSLRELVPKIVVATPLSSSEFRAVARRRFEINVLDGGVSELVPA